MSGADPETEELFTSDRHVVWCTHVLQSAETTTFLDRENRVRAAWPTALVEAFRWPKPDAGSARSEEEDPKHDDMGPPLGSALGTEQSASHEDSDFGYMPGWTLARTAPPEHDRVLPRTWRDELREMRSTARAVEHWEAVSSMLGEGGQCTTCGDRYIDFAAHACNR